MISPTSELFQTGDLSQISDLIQIVICVQQLQTSVYNIKQLQIAIFLRSRIKSNLNKLPSDNRLQIQHPNNYLLTSKLIQRSRLLQTKEINSNIYYKKKISDYLHSTLAQDKIQRDIIIDPVRCIHFFYHLNIKVRSKQDCFISNFI